MSKHSFKDEFSLVSDGKRMILHFGTQTFILDDFFITGMTLNVDVDKYFINESEFVEGLKSTSLSIDLVGGEVCVTDEEQLDYKFAMDMTIRELLETVNKKLEKRKED